MSNKPALRFQGFTDAWEQRKFGEMYERVSQKNDLAFGIDKIISVANMYYRSDIYITASEYLKTYNVLRLGDIAFEGNKSKDFAHGRFVENTVGDGIVSHVFVVFRPKMEYDLWFWKYAINNERLMKDILLRSTKSSTMMTDLVASDFLEENFLVPCIEEQKLIGEALTELDRLLTLHQREFLKLTAAKKSLLEKMFPRDGAAVPEIRFAGFTGAWEQRPLGELADIVRGASPRPIKDPKWFDADSDIGWLRISDVTEQDGRIHFLEQHISKAGQEKTRVLTGPHLLLSIAATVGKPVINYVSTGVHDGFLIFQNAQFDREFMFQWLEMFRPRWSKFGQPGSQVNLNSDLVKSKEIMLPAEDEQRQIGQFFAALDHLLTLHQRELKKLQSMKKALLEKMFV